MHHPKCQHSDQSPSVAGQTGPGVIKMSMLNLAETEISTARKKKYCKIKTFLELSDVVFIILINDKTPTIVGILTFMSMINFVPS